MIKVVLSLFLAVLLAVGGYMLLNFETPEVPEPSVENPAHVHEYVITVVEPTCSAQGYTINTCKDCGYVMCDTIVGIAPEAHLWVVSEVVDSTCTATGTKTYTCEYCSETKDEEVAITSHSFGEWAETLAPTCTESGEESRACQVCSHSETRAVDALGHSWDEGTVTAPTCLDEGYTTHTCTACSETKIENKVAATGHTMGEWAVETAPTCTAEGLEIKTCENGCGYTESQTMAVLEHNWDDGKVTEPTCVAPGYTVYSCKDCYTTKTETGADALAHELGDWYVKTAPTCTEDGEERRDCKNCDFYVSAVLGSTGHDIGDWEVHTPATCENGGEERKNCNNCDHYESRATDAIGHKYGDNWYVHTDSTCEAEGESRNYCENGCGRYESEVISIHHYDVVTNVAPTCCKEGVYEIICRDCGDRQVTVLEALGHSYGEWKEIGTSGQEMRECSACGSVEIKSKD